MRGSSIITTAVKLMMRKKPIETLMEKEWLYLFCRFLLVVCAGAEYQNTQEPLNAT